jgi:hypothetical protein
MKAKPEKTEASVTGARETGGRSIRIRVEDRQAASQSRAASP